MVTLNASDCLHLDSPVTHSGLLLGIIVQLIKQFPEAALLSDYDGESGNWPHFFTNISKRFALEGGTLRALCLNLHFKISKNADVKMQIQEQLTDQSHSISAVAQEVLNQLRGYLSTDKQGKQYDGFVLIIDELEQVRGYNEQELSAIDSMRKLLTAHADQFGFKGWHLVLTVPPYVPIEVQNIQQDFGEIFFISNLHVYQQHASQPTILLEEDGITPKMDAEDGVEKMREILAKRLSTMPEVLFRALEPCIAVSAGNFAALALLVNQCLAELSYETPLADKEIHAAVQAVIDRRCYELRSSPQEYRAVLHKLRTLQPCDLTEDERIIATLLADAGLLATYMNGHPWYAPPSVCVCRPIEAV